ncbi:copper chaperone CopZ [Salimicrobium halophilum]|uniref:Copper chaperone CopZ n=1 Tax=Salimicrobium halophilum TaxID=86666 RepID=A0A1G8WKJ4_9BACI|nr:copper chaperone CopZ [Salimicrobium halophilum]SDJ78898.1 copper chaperone [Salimicrobium halophilum]
MEKTLNVQGMTCGHCESAVKGALGELDGVKDVQVSLDSGKVDVTYEEGKVTEEQMKDAVEEQGYDVE